MELKLRNKLAFCFGAFGKDIVYMLVNSFILYYYNVVLGVSGTFVGAVLMGARVFDAINDPFMGIIVAKTKTRFGRFRPWILSGTVVNAFVLFALFAVPGGMADNPMRIWLAVFYILWGVSYTLMDIPFWSMIPAITKPGKEREQLSSLARSSSGIGDALPTVLTMVIVPVLSGTTAIAGYRLGFKYWALIIAVVFVISEIVFCLNVPEKKPEDMKTVGIGHMFKSLFKNDQAMTVIGAIILVYLALDIVGNLILYFFQYDVGNTNVYSIFTAVAFLAQVIFMLLIPALRRKIPKLRLFAVGILVQIIGFLILLGFSFTGLYQATSWAILCLPGMMVYAGYGVLNVMLTVFLSDSVDYGQLKNGTREEAVIFSMQTFTVKLASGIAVFFSGLVVDMLHLSSEASASDIAATSADTRSKLRLVMTVPPIIILIAAFIIFKRFYKLNDERMKEISEQIHGDAAEIADDTAEGGEDR